MSIEHIIPLRRGFVRTPQHKRAKKAVTVLKAYLARHLKADEIKIGQHLNEFVWGRGMRNPPGKVAVTANYVTIDGKKIAHVELQGKKFSESVRPAEKAEEATGLKGKLQAFAQNKDKPAEAKEAEQKAPEAPQKTVKPAEKPAAKPSSPKKTVKTK